ncbi:amidohydrolase family protein [uncultured Erythrobacter sp.]|uniref:N-acyl-D-amino-acid deacylase family protein n=1 Tax=uncultured Erythrobacter sp. TaxID=263913 RepID=UPI00262CE0C2|nr:amidohydrolase family protein [uncultured Erythrobacter sp.]
MVKRGAVLLAALAWTLSLPACQALPDHAAEQREAADLIIAGGMLFDGSGQPGEMADIAIAGDRIAYVGPDAAALYRAGATIDASGLVVAPGFIDPHTHAETDLAAEDPARRANYPFAFQGVSTVVVGNDGFGDHNVGELISDARARGIGSNAAFLVGFGSVREAVLGTQNRAPNAAEMAQMEALTRQAMCEGAWGLSAGLYYVPQSYSSTEEVTALARIAGSFGGYYDTHMRDESTYNVTVTGALAETLDIGRAADIRVHIAHIKALGPAVWGHSAQMIAMIEEARAGGQQVTADQYPWEASGTRISNALVPRWALEGGLEALRERLGDAASRDRIRNEMVDAIARRGGADRLLVTGQLSGSDAPIGKTLAEIAETEARAPVDSAIAILESGDARLASFNMDAADIAAFARQNWVVTGSDGSTGHPRKFGSFPKAYRDLVLGEEAMDLARFIRRSSGLTADIIGLEKRGYLRNGYFADVLVFDPESFAPNATYSAPRELSSGVIHLYINGQAVIRDEAPTGTLSGRPLVKDTQC